MTNLPITSTDQLVPAPGLAGYAKAVVAFVVSLLASLRVVLPADGGLGDVTLAQWIGVAIAVLGTPAGVYAVPNKVAKTPPNPVLPKGV